MSLRSLSSKEKEYFNRIVGDLKIIFGQEEILPEELDNILTKLQTEEVKTYLKNLAEGSKPETALREAFFAGKSILSKCLFGEAIPEVRENGFIDYLLKDERGRLIVLELKSLFEAERIRDKSGRFILRKLKQNKLNWLAHKNQILKYLRESEYVILTNLKQWLFFSRSSIPKLEPFYEIDFFQFIKEYEVVGNLKEYADRKEFQSIRYDLLTKEFFENLKKWVEKLSEVKFTVDDRRKLELIINLINKFIFIQTLDDYDVIEFKWLMKTWDYLESRWYSKGKFEVLKRFIEEINNWFSLYYDTELFKENILDYVEKDEANIEKLYRNILLILGLAYWKTPYGDVKGIMQYNFRQIDEDVLGKAYETFLAEQRKEEGAYYTPKYITIYIVKNTLGEILNKIISDIEDAVKNEDLDRLERDIKRLISVKVLDPACGSGSFLIKALRELYDTYSHLLHLINKLNARYNKWSSLSRPKEIEIKANRLNSLLKLLSGNNRRTLISKILIRHIHGNDKDRRALEVAKINLWLEAIKLAPEEFRFDRLPKETSHILPDLEMNLCSGDSLVGLPEDLTIEFLNKYHKNDIIKLNRLRSEYLDDPTKQELIRDINQLKNILREKLNEEFKRFLKRKGLPLEILKETQPLHWALEFWYFYFDKDGNPLPKEARGADVVIGNPPYERIQILNKKSPIYVQYLNKVGYETAFKNYDLAIIFIEKGFKLLNKNGEFGYIVTHKFMQADYGEKIREFLSRGKYIKQIVNFGDQQVFDDATTYTALLFLKKTGAEKVKYALIKRLKHTLDQLFKITKLDEYADEDILIFIQDAGSLTKEPWMIANLPQEILIKKIHKLPRLARFSRIFVGLQTSADEVYVLEFKDEVDSLVRVFSKSMNRDYLLEKPILKPLLKGKDISRWVINRYNYLLLFPYIIKGNKAILIDEKILREKYPNSWRYLLDNKHLLEKRERGSWAGRPDWYGYVYLKNMDKFNLPKILVQVLASKATFALDLEGKYYFTGGGGAAGYGIILTDRSLTLPYVCGLLNSSLLDWYIKRISPVYRGGYFVYAKRYLEKLPIKLPKNEIEKDIARNIQELVTKICNIEKAKFILFSLWSDWSVKLKNGEIRLFDVLIQDKNRMQTGEFDKCWIEKVTFFPGEEHKIMNKEFFRFKIRGENKANTLKILGIDENGKEDTIYEIEFRDRGLTIHVYFSILKLLESRSKVKTLEHLLKKTIIPIIKPNARLNTINILKKVENEAKKALNDGDLETFDIIVLDNEIEDIEAKIDALVFKLYGLDESEIHLVLNSLNLSSSYQQLVLKYFHGNT